MKTNSSICLILASINIVTLETSIVKVVCQIIIKTLITQNLTQAEISSKMLFPSWHLIMISHMQNWQCWKQINVFFIA